MKRRKQGRNGLIARRSLIRSAAAAGLLPGAARARSFPSKQLRLLVGAAAGGGADIDPDQGAERARGAVGGQQGMETPASTASEAAAHIARETEIWKKVIADAGIRLE
jgi:tripartite-type tricarboxylate transporter receptor subunit TctC